MRRWLHLKLEDETDQWSPPGIERIGGTLAVGEGEGREDQGQKGYFSPEAGWAPACYACVACHVCKCGKNIG